MTNIKQAMGPLALTGILTNVLQPTHRKPPVKASEKSEAEYSQTCCLASRPLNDCRT
jgi:hypothetical protein